MRRKHVAQSSSLPPGGGREVGRAREAAKRERRGEQHAYSGRACIGTGGQRGTHG